MGCNHKFNLALLLTIFLHDSPTGYASRTRPEDLAADIDIASRSANASLGDLGPLPTQRKLWPINAQQPPEDNWWLNLKTPGQRAKQNSVLVERFLAEHCGSVSQFLGNATACREYSMANADRRVLEADLATLVQIDNQVRREEEVEEKFDMQEGEPLGVLAILDRPKVYFDFSRPLSLTLRKTRKDETPVYFHYTEEEYAKLNDTQTRYVFAITPLSHDELKAATGTEVSGYDIATSGAGSVEGFLRKQLGAVTGASITTSDTTTSRANNAAEGCESLGIRFGRTDIVAPILSTSVFEECRARWGEDSHFERCLMVRGCAARDKFEGHRGILRPLKRQSYLGGLPADSEILTSLPMCCGRSLRASLRIWYLTHVAYETLGIRPPADAHEEIKGLSMESEHINKLLDQRMQSYGQAQEMLTATCAEDVQEALMTSGLIGNMKNVIMAVKDSVAHLLSAIEKLAHGMIHGSSTSLDYASTAPIAESWLATAKDLMSRAFKVGKKVVVGTLKTLASVAKWLLEKGYSLTKWVLGHPQAAVLLSSIVVEIRTRLCSYFSETWFVQMGHGGPEVLDVGPGEYLFRKGIGVFKEVMPTKAQLMVIVTQFLQTSSFWGKTASMLTNVFTGVFGVFGIPWAVLKPFMEILGAVALDSLQNAAKLELFRLIEDTGSRLFFQPCLVRPTVMKVINPLAGVLQHSHEFTEEDMGMIFMA